MLNALPTQTPATGQAARLLPQLAAEPGGQRAAAEARQGFAALMQQHSDLHLADLHLADLQAADLKLADAALARARSADQRSADHRSADPRPADTASAHGTGFNHERSTAQAEPAKTGALASAATSSAARPVAQPAAQPARQSPGSEAGDASKAAHAAEQAPAPGDAGADGAVDPATAAAAAAATGPADSRAPLGDAAEQALADAAAQAQPGVLLRGRGAGLPGATTADGLPIRRLPRTTPPPSATEATAAATRLAASDTTHLPAGEALPQAGDASGLATTEADTTALNPDPATLQPWLQAQAMVTHWRPVGADAQPATGTDTLLAATTGREGLAGADPAITEPGLLAQRPAAAGLADGRAAATAAAALGSDTTGLGSIGNARAGDGRTGDGTAAVGALPTSDPALAEAARSAALDTRRATALRTAGSPDIGHRASWRPDPEQADTAGRINRVEARTAPDQALALAADSAALPGPLPALATGQAQAALPAAGAGDVATPLAPAATAALATAGHTAAALRGLNDAATPGARSTGDRPGAAQAERRSNTLDADGSTGPRPVSPDTLTANPAHQPMAATGDRPGADARADAALAAKPGQGAEASDAGLANNQALARAVEGGLPALAGVQAPASRGEPPSRNELPRAEALQAAAGNGPVTTGHINLPGGAAPVAQTTTAFAPLLATAAAAAPQAEATLNVPLDSPDFAPALGAQISLFTREGVQTARLQLNPAEMGPISVQIALDGSAARVDFQADVAATREVIEASLPALAGALQEAGLTLAGGGVFQHAPGQQQQAPEDRATQAAQARGRAEPNAAGHPADAVGPVAVRSRGLVDLVA